MNKIILGFSLFSSVSLFSQVSLGVRANAIINASSSDWREFVSSVKNVKESSGENISGYNVGLASKIDIPATSFSVMPEIYYTHFSNKNTIEKSSIKISINRIDVPILLGYKILPLVPLYAYTGPVFSYYLNDYGSSNLTKQNENSKLRLGYQLGLGFNFSHFTLNARYESSFTKRQTNFVINQLAHYHNLDKLEFSLKQRLFIVGVGYNF